MPRRSAKPGAPAAGSRLSGAWWPVPGRASSRSTSSASSADTVRTASAAAYALSSIATGTMASASRTRPSPSRGQGVGVEEAPVAVGAVGGAADDAQQVDVDRVEDDADPRLARPVLQP